MNRLFPIYPSSLPLPLKLSPSWSTLCFHICISLSPCFPPSHMQHLIFFPYKIKGNFMWWKKKKGWPGRRRLRVFSVLPPCDHTKFALGCTALSFGSLHCISECPNAGKAVAFSYVSEGVEPQGTEPSPLTWAIREVSENLILLRSLHLIWINTDTASHQSCPSTFWSEDVNHSSQDNLFLL